MYDSFRITLLFFKKTLKITKGNQNPYIEEEQTTQWPNEIVQKDKQRSTKHTYKNKDRVTRTLYDFNKLFISISKRIPLISLDVHNHCCSTRYELVRFRPYHIFLAGTANR
jgi:hypothetical protein